MPDEVVTGAKRDITLGGTTLELNYVGKNHSDSMLEPAADEIDRDRGHHEPERERQRDHVCHVLIDRSELRRCRKELNDPHERQRDGHDHGNHAVAGE